MPPYAGACTGLNPSFEPAGPSDDEALYGKASRTLQGCRATVKAAARLLELLPSDAPAVLASLPQGGAQGGGAHIRVGRLAACREGARQRLCLRRQSGCWSSHVCCVL